MQLNLSAKLSALLLLVLPFITSCNDEVSVEAPEYDLDGVIIANAGNYGSGNGSLDLYNESTGVLSRGVFESANGRQLAAGIESVGLKDSIGLIQCNAADKVEFFHAETFKTLAAPIAEGIVKPRYVAFNGDFAYVTCWGKNTPEWTLPDSYVAKISLNDFKVVKELKTGEGAEGIAVSDGKIFVANSYETSVSVFDVLTDQLIEKIEVKGKPQHFVKDREGGLWLSLSEIEKGIVSINTSSLEVSDVYEQGQIGSDGAMAYSIEQHKIYLLGASPWYQDDSGEWVNDNEGWIFEFDLNSKQFADQPIVAGPTFYGLGFDDENQKLYLSDPKGFVGNGQALIYDVFGEKEKSLDVGMNPFHFVFR
ncbi:YncE family protein [Aureibacter tunicatorum]|uniref:YVTN family beta-propeller protein n=1 Tax=Aureibacter tunicatorum TaxID=866807 RepID=A0AAE3XSK8_9BACT|nr:DUF5074 domain-containing protein [Aureibacter tunicatorum]MDR6241230.1 YVTN family beta-propeller protein [Aureibacter tunicatorum]BDD03490.1 hypothetical protein AUTU_09730 [Aureibacter tunicatorum]